MTRPLIRLTPRPLALLPCVGSGSIGSPSSKAAGTATAIKNVSLAEEHLHDHFPGAPVMPNSLIIEGLAQTGGLLVAEHGGFEERVVLAKMAKARFHFPAVPGDTLTYRVTIEDIHKDGAIVSGTSHVGRAAASRGADLLRPPGRSARPASRCSIRPACWPCSSCWACSTSAATPTDSRWQCPTALLQKQAIG